MRYNDGGESMGKYEEPHYKVLHQEKDVEIRAYEPYVTVATPDGSLSGSGFNRLFSFISGQNQSNQKMAMTIPVINDAKESTMEFVLPLHIKHIDEAPIPTSSQLKLKQYPKEKVAVIYFSGRMTEGLIQKELTRLKKVVETMGYILKDHYRLARYNSPFSLPFLRRNEILCSIEDKDE
jgi:hypothetical protein